MNNSEASVRAEALESLLIDKGLIVADQIDQTISLYNERVGPMNGARVVAKAWKNAEYRKRLLDDGSKAIEEFAFVGGQVDKLVVVENTSSIHNVVVCTLCSCYPWAVLGLPPRWYKDPAYRSRVVREPRKVLEEMGTIVPKEKRIRVWDSSAEIRYMVLPELPSDWADLSEPDLAERVSRDSMIGVQVLDSPGST
ncbi:MAG: nitrile hydratase subunit alpha [Proteobacteria bacterium TMED261]|nr:MAG: nitrile hydratase subunit alpha [Proteobacteria bacterium TMED261]